MTPLPYLRCDETQSASRPARRYIERRIKDYPAYVNLGPGEDDGPIKLITVRFYAEQAAIYTWFSIPAEMPT